MKLLFLDIDGVLNDHVRLESGYCGISRPHASRLNRILRAVPEAELVISSAWRYLILSGHMNLAGFEYLLLANGVACKGRLHGHTSWDGALPDDQHFDRKAWEERGLIWRVNQIREYLAGLATEPRFVVVDDLDLEIAPIVRTDGAKGMTDADADRIIAVLNGGAA